MSELPIDDGNGNIIIGKTVLIVHIEDAANTTKTNFDLYDEIENLVRHEYGEKIMVLPSYIQVERLMYDKNDKLVKFIYQTTFGIEGYVTEMSSRIVDRLADNFSVIAMRGSDQLYLL